MARRGYKLQEFIAHGSDVKCLTIGRKSSRVFVSGGEDRKVNLWSIGKLNPLLSLSGHNSSVESVALDSAEVLVLGGSSTGIIKLWDLEEAKIVRTLTGHRASCTAVGFHPFGEFFASGSLDTDLKIWDIRKKGCIHTYKGHTGAIQTIKFTPDGRWVVTGGMDNVVKLWDLTAGKLLHEFKFHNGQIRCIDFHPHEFLLATGSADRTVKFWDLETFELIGSAGPEATGVRSMIFHPDGKTLFCGLDSTLKVFSWEPIRCHDNLDMGWSTLADLSVYEGKLLGCSFHESRVGIWVADISLIDPYALGGVPKSNGLSEASQNHQEDISLELKESCRKSTPIQNIGSEDYGNKVREATRDIYMISNDGSESVSDEIDSTFPSKLSRAAATGTRKSMAANSLSIPSKANSKLSSRAKFDSSSVNDAKTTQRPRTPQNKAEPFALSRSSSLCSSATKSNNILNSRKCRLKEMPDPTDLQTDVSVSFPIIVPRGFSLFETADTSRIMTPSVEASFSSMDCKPSHVSKAPIGAAFSENQKIEILSGLSRRIRSNVEGGQDMETPMLAVNLKAEKDDGKELASSGNILEKLERSLSLQSQDDNDSRSTCSSTENNSIKYVKGVAIRSGRTRSLVERFEKKETCDVETIETSQSIESNLRTVDDDLTPEALMENRDVFTNALKSRFTKLQVVRHFWEQNGIKGAINAVAKLPDHAVLVDVFSILHDKIDQFTLDMFLRLLPLLSGLLNSKTERHITVSLGILVDLVKTFKPVITSTLSASSVVGVDLHQEQRIQRCVECSKYLENIKEMLPPLIRRGGLLAKPAGELHILLHVHD